jgi:outer membrane protein OmpA-like peptidoglycan-associated protein
VIDMLQRQASKQNPSRQLGVDPDLQHITAPICERERWPENERVIGNQAAARLLQRRAAAGAFTGTFPQSTTAGAEPALQRKCACGGTPAGPSGECEECGKKTIAGLQTKLRISERGDIYEQEADRVADQVMAMSARPGSAPPRIQRFTATGTGQEGAAPPSVDRALAGPGRPLEPAVRQDMEQRFGHDFSGVRVHADAAAAQSARDVSAHAYTVGHSIVFDAGRFAPRTNEGRQLLVHELTHVVQQEHGTHKIQRWADCKPARLSLEDCPPRKPGEVSRALSRKMFFFDDLKNDPALGTGETGALIAYFDIGSARMKPILDNALWTVFLEQIALKRSKWRLLGFTDCQGEEGLNQNLRKERAQAIFNFLPQAIQSQIISHDGAPITDCITENNTEDDRGLNRSVAFILEESIVSEPPEAIPVMSILNCDLSKVLRECAGAAGQCASIQGTYCKDHYSTPSAIDAKLQRQASPG